ncbi:PREDICTED: muscarinic acetylcholine receptor M5-like [Branchiostoma belcheri]|uniref:Muscarinic acetylcholine receptor M5-like n=1 Tax=Branchiostoma belcheri TaxID=7741 RepID=A0A6P4Z5N5_BRABE|nr:PREDICTED: muscarinic acetylcholine receptor M5-like [Branchiostoma belcheri]
MVLVALVRERMLRTVYNYFILNLALADLSVGLVIMPLSATYVAFGNWPFGSAMCVLWVLMDFGCRQVSIFTLLLIAGDRYCSIRWPTTYVARRTAQRTIPVVVLTWAVAVTIWAPGVASSLASDAEQCMLKPSSNIAFTVTSAMLSYHLPVVSIVALYSRMTVLLIRKMKTKHAKRKIVPLDMPNSISKVSGQADEVLPGTSDPSCSHSHRINRQERREIRAVRTLAVVSVVFLVCWLPFITMYLVTAACPACVSSTAYNVSYWLAYINSSLNPIVYSLLSPEFRKAFKKVLRIGSRATSQVGRQSTLQAG